MGSNNYRRLILADLGQGLPGLSTHVGMSKAEACSVCLQEQNHSNGVVHEVKGTFNENFIIEWDRVGQQAFFTWHDPEEATEEGAVALAVLLVLSCTNYTVIRRSRKKTGIDYWLGREADMKLEARLEVSGIRNETVSSLNEREKIKIEQTKQSDDSSFPVYIVVVGFKKPQSKVILR